jgi:hypothetical protein
VREERRDRAAPRLRVSGGSAKETLDPGYGVAESETSVRRSCEGSAAF